MENNQNRQIATIRAGTERSLDSSEIVIIGNGIAGLTAAVEARRQAPDKRIVIITDQVHPTINTPALKQFAIAKLTREQLLAYPAGTERAERIHVVSARVEQIHAQHKYLTLNNNRCFGYGSLLIATGSHPMGLPESTPGRNFDGVMMLHRLQDYLDLRRRIPEVREAVVIGGGVHANETVMGLLYWGIRVHWLIRGKTFMGKMLDPTASEMVLESVRKAGAIIHMQTEVTGIIGRIGAVAGVITNHQEMIPCQLVLTCTGTAPSMALAKSCSVPMMHKNGILVDHKLRTSVRDIYAAGDVAALPNPQTGSYETRAQWYSAVNQARMVGALMAGNTDAVRPFGVQWHATHVGELSMLTVGEPLSRAKDVTILTDSSASGYRRLAVCDDRLIGYLSLGSTQPDSLAIKQIIDEGYSIREVTRKLLKGTLDPRAYLARLGSRAARGIMTGRLPFPSPAPAISERAERRAPEVGPLPQPRTTRQTGQLVHDIPLSARQDGARQPVMAARQSFVYEEAIGPLAGNQTTDQRASDPVSPLPAIFEEEPSPFTGNLPAFSGPVIDSTLARATEPKRATRNLWEYTDERQEAHGGTVRR